MGMNDLKSGGRLRASALPQRCFLLVRHISNTRVPPLIRQYPSRQKIVHTHYPRLLIWRAYPSEYSRENTYGTGRVGDFSDGVRILCFPKPSVLGFPTSIDHADRRCHCLI
jgi:hypothetical protein